jgi:hypothetical protein
VGSHAAACAGADDDDVVGFGRFFDLKISHFGKNEGSRKVKISG